MTSRRGFLGALAGAIAGAGSYDPERALWVPGAKTISIPRPGPTFLLPWASFALKPEEWERTFAPLRPYEYVVLRNLREVIRAKQDATLFYALPARLKIGDMIAIREQTRFIGQ